MHEMKNTLDGINSGLDIVEENFRKHEKITVETEQSKKTKENKKCMEHHA